MALVATSGKALLLRCLLHKDLQRDNVARNAAKLAHLIDCIYRVISNLAALHAALFIA